MRRLSIVVVGLCVAVACSRGDEAEGGAATGTAAPAPAAAASAEPANAPEAAAPPAPYTGYDYACGDGRSFHARMEQGNAVVTLEGKTLTLVPVEGAFGAQYAGEGVTFIARGEEAMLSREDGVLLTCKAQN